MTTYDDRPLLPAEPRLSADQPAAYCTKCGRPLVERTSPTGEFSAWNGKPTFERWAVCPEWRTLPWSQDNGHSWSYGGDQNTKGDPPDPGVYEYPPRPPVPQP